MSLRGRRAFWRVWIAQAVSVTGDGMHRAALLWWAASTRSTGAVGVLALCSMLPLIVCSPAAGRLADRWPRRRLMVGADALRVCTSAALAVAIAARGVPFALVAALTVVAAIGESVFAPAFAATITQLLPAEDRAAGNAMNLANSATGGMLGPALGGLLVAAIGSSSVMAVDALTFVVSALLVGTAVIPSVGGRSAVGEHQQGGWAIVRRSPDVRRVAVLAAVLNLFTGPTPVLLVALVVKRLHHGPGVYGALDACAAAGMLLGVLVVGRLARRSPVSAMRTGLLLLGAGFVFVGAVASAWWAATLFIVAGVGVAVANSFVMAHFQDVVAEDEQGRVFGVVGGLANALRPLGLAAAGPMIAAIGPAGGYAVCGAAIALATIVGTRGAGVSPSGASRRTRESRREQLESADPLRR